MSGYERLKNDVMRDCNDLNACGCFNPDGCSHDGAKIGTYGEHGYKSCFHHYCDKFKWVIDRAKHYGEKLGIPWEKVLDSWEDERNYWYMNYYQECNQPLIKGNDVRIFETTDDLLASIGKDGFRCPSCGRVSRSPYECTCDWKVYGLFGGLGKDVFIYCKDKVRGERMFMPIAWEKEEHRG